MACNGCAPLDARPVPGSILALREPDTSRDYQLYLPSRYSADQQWPLVIVCHAQWPLDWPKAQIDEWKDRAESKGFLVAAPKLLSTSPGLSDDSAAQVSRQRQDEEAILGIIAHIRAARSIDTNAIFIYGWLGGAYPALFTGLKNPDVFRAVALRQPSFDSRYIQPTVPYLDHQQPIQAICGFSDLTDFTRKDGLACVEWLREHRMAVSEEETPSANKREPEAVYAFMHQIVRTHAWIRVTVLEADPGRPLAVRFSLQSSVPIDLFLWDFGDGQSSRVASPEHVYAKPGTYAVRVTVTSGRKSHARGLELHVPRARLGTTQPGAR
jgi:hypothetical protein